MDWKYSFFLFDGVKLQYLKNKCSKSNIYWKSRCPSEYDVDFLKDAFLLVKMDCLKNAWISIKVLSLSWTSTFLKIYTILKNIYYQLRVILLLGDAECTTIYNFDNFKKKISKFSCFSYFFLIITNITVALIAYIFKLPSRKLSQRTNFNCYSFLQRN